MFFPIFLCIGQTSASLFILGNIPSLSGILIIDVNGYTKNWENSISYLVAILLGPKAFEDFVSVLLQKYAKFLIDLGFCLSRKYSQRNHLTGFTKHNTRNTLKFKEIQKYENYQRKKIIKKKWVNLKLDYITFPTKNYKKEMSKLKTGLYYLSNKKL